MPPRAAALPRSAGTAHPTLTRPQADTAEAVAERTWRRPEPSAATLVGGRSDRWSRIRQRDSASMAESQRQACMAAGAFLASVVSREFLVEQVVSIPAAGILASCRFQGRPFAPWQSRQRRCLPTRERKPSCVSWKSLSLAR